MSKLVPQDRRALVAIDLGAESCRVSLLRWHGSKAEIRLVHRFANRPEQKDGGLRWPLGRILEELHRGLTMSSTIAAEGIRSIGVDGWAVDYVRLGTDGKPMADP